jgi:hypothetical protein
MGKELLNEIKGLIREVAGPAGSPLMLEDDVYPLEARRLWEFVTRIEKSWNRAYGEFARAKEMMKDIAATYAESTSVSRSGYEKKDVSKDTEESLIKRIHMVSRHFRSNYEEEIVKEGGNLRAMARQLKDAAQSAKSLKDESLKDSAVNLVRQFLPFVTAVGYLYGSIGSILRDSEEIMNRYLPPDQRPRRPARSKRGPTYRGMPQDTTEQIAQLAGDIIERLDIFVRLSEPTLDELGKLEAYADEAATKIPHGPIETPAAELVPMESKSSRRVKKIHALLEFDWEKDPDFGIVD